MQRQKQHFSSIIMIAFILVMIVIPLISSKASNYLKLIPVSTDDPLSLQIVSVVADGFPSNWILARVFDDSGNVVLGLTESNFTLWENGTSAPVTIDTTFNYMAVSLVMDQSGSMAGWGPNVVAACSYFVDEMLTLDRGAIIKFSNTAYVDVTMTYNKTMLLNSIAAYYTSGLTALWDAIALGIQECYSEPTKKVVIAFTDGLDNASYIAYTALPGMTGGEITIYTIGIGNNINVSALTYVAENTGGFFIQINDPTQMQEVLTDIREDIYSQYALYYYSPQPQPDSTMRTVTVEVEYQGETAQDSITYTAPSTLPCQVALTPAFIQSINIPRRVGSQVPVYCTIVSTVPAYEYIAFYCLAGSFAYYETNLTWTGGQNYMFTVPGNVTQYPGFDFYISATNSMNYTSTLPHFQPAVYPLSVPVGANYLPRVIHVPPYYALEGENLEISAQVMDEGDSVESVTLFYRVLNQPMFNSVPMTHQGGELYTGEIPASVLLADIDVEYFIRAMDNLDVSAYWPADSEPQTVDVLAAAPPSMPFCTLTLNSSSVIPAQGDSLNFTIEIENPGLSAVTGDVWLSFYCPEGREKVRWRFTGQMTFQPGIVYQKTINDFIGANHPAGSYWIYCQVGDFGEEVWSYGAFNFIKTETEIAAENSSELVSVINPEYPAFPHAYPNPFNSEVSIPFILNQPGFVNISIYNPLGQEILNLTDSYYSAGRHEKIWDGRDFTGNMVSSGIYLYKVSTGADPGGKELIHSGRLIFAK
ncbi:VWA domain-containing protein [bacterium]|nr:VWA domain-containing protein [bacterium]